MTTLTDAQYIFYNNFLIRPYKVINLMNKILLPLIIIYGIYNYKTLSKTYFAFLVIYLIFMFCYYYFVSQAMANIITTK